jgi:hypothetical protein
MKRTAFYPCCGCDIDEPSRALAGIVDRIVFCDIRPIRRAHRPAGTGTDLVFWKKDILVALDDLPIIDVFFYRRDGASEGGSGIWVLGRTIFPMILARMTRDDCKIMTDGSNSRGGTFRKMKRNSGLLTNGKHITKSTQQRFAHLGMLEFDVVSANPLGVETP